MILDFRTRKQKKNDRLTNLLLSFLFHRVRRHWPSSNDHLAVPLNLSQNAFKPSKAKMKLSKPPCNLPGIGVFGCNKLSEFLVNSLIKNGFRITAVWSDQLEQARTFAQKFKIEFHTDKIDVLLLKKEVELILINCEQSLYVQIVTKAFRIGESL